MWKFDLQRKKQIPIDMHMPINSRQNSENDQSMHLMKYDAVILSTLCCEICFLRNEKG